MKSRPASSTEPGIPPGSGPGSTPDRAATDTATRTTGGTSGAFGSGGPLSVKAVWTAPVINPPEPRPEEDLTDSQTDILNFFQVGSDPDERVRSSEEPPALTGQLGLAAVAELDSNQALDALKDIGEARSWLDAQEAKLATRVLDLQTERSRAGCGDLGYELTLAASEIGAALHLPQRTAGFLLDHSMLLTRHCPATLNALEKGRLSRRHAWAVAEETSSMPDTMTGEVAADYESRLISLASHTTVAKFYYQALRLRETFHPESITTRHQKAVRNREVVLSPAHDGMARLEAYLAVEDAAGIFHRIDTAARNLQGPDEPRTLTQLRTDVLVDVLTSAGPTGHMTGGPESVDEPGPADGNRSGRGSRGNGASRDSDAYWGVQAKVFVTVPVTTLLGGDEPGELEGYGPIDPDTARKLAGHAPSFFRILTHPQTGARLGADATTYRVPQDLQDAVRVRDGTCRHPGCNRLAVFCELDHTIPWSQGGKTSYGNLACLCKRHHMFKTEGYWHYTQPEPGTIIAISPAGETYLTKPNPPPAPPKPSPPGSPAPF